MLKFKRAIVGIFAAICLSGFPIFVSPGIKVRNAAIAGAEIAPGALVAVTATGNALGNYFRFDSPLKLRLIASDNTITPIPSIASPSERERAENTTVWSVIPSTAPLGPAKIEAETSTATYSVDFTISSTGPGLFTLDYRGSGPALAQNDGVRNALTSAAVPGQEVNLFATGLGTARTADVSVELAGQVLPASFAGPQGEWPGLDQINFHLPPTPPFLGCYVPVAIRVRGVLSNVATLSINRDRFACAHPLGLSYSDLVTLDRGASITVAQFFAFGAYGDRPPSENTTLLFRRMDAAAVAQLAGPQLSDARYFSCAPLPADQILLADPERIDAGPVVTFSGPGFTTSLEQDPWYSETFNRSVPGFTAGSWMVSAPGGSDVPSFAQSFRLAPVLLNATAKLEPAELVVNWNTSGYVPTDVVTLALENASATKKMNCNARATDGVIRIPRASLATLEPLRRDLALLIRPYNPVRTVFKIERRSGDPISAFADFYYSLVLRDGIQ